MQDPPRPACGMSEKPRENVTISLWHMTAGGEAE